LVVGLELSRELRYGELRSRRAALLLAGALGWMVGAGLVSLAVAHSGVPLRGYGMPMATDVAFVVGTLSLFGASPSSWGCVLALAVADDLASLGVQVLG
jgi:NhaA family Na+:H+ antiporter